MPYSLPPVSVSISVLGCLSVPLMLASRAWFFVSISPTSNSFSVPLSAVPPRPKERLLSFQTVPRLPHTIVIAIGVFVQYLLLPDALMVMMVIARVVSVALMRVSSSAVIVVIFMRWKKT